MTDFIITEMPRTDSAIRDLCYYLYKMDWMRRISTDRQMDAYKTWHEEEYLPNIEPIFNVYTGETDTVFSGQDFPEWIEEHGYDGEIYASRFEFFENEYWDKMYIESLLNNEKLYSDYLKEVEA